MGRCEGEGWWPLQLRFMFGLASLPEIWLFSPWSTSILLPFCKLLNLQSWLHLYKMHWTPGLDWKKVAVKKCFLLVLECLVPYAVAIDCMQRDCYWLVLGYFRSQCLGWLFVELLGSTCILINPNVCPSLVYLSVLLCLSVCLPWQCLSSELFLLTFNGPSSTVQCMYIWYLK